VTSILKIHSKSPVSGKFGTISVFDTIPDRLAAALEMGASQALLPGGSKGPFDVSIEVSGNVRALQSAIDHTSNGGRIIAVGSWYGNTEVKLKLDIDFHRSHNKTIQNAHKLVRFQPDYWACGTNDVDLGWLGSSSNRFVLRGC
jgi:threonine dehydrogenase-like Zn-dependent dehydrogenase